MIATSLSGTNPIFLRITLRIKSDDAPSRLTASFLPLSCAADENELHVEPILFEEPSLFGNPNKRLANADRRIADLDFRNLGRRHRSEEEAQNCNERDDQ